MRAVFLAALMLLLLAQLVSIVPVYPAILSHGAPIRAASLEGVTTVTESGARRERSTVSPSLRQPGSIRLNATLRLTRSRLAHALCTILRSCPSSTRASGLHTPSMGRATSFSASGWRASFHALATAYTSASTHAYLLQRRMTVRARSWQAAVPAVRASPTRTTSAGGG